MPDTPTPKDPATPKPRATILVCYHKFSTPIIASEILRPIIVGAANMGEGARSLQEKLESKLPKNLRLGGGQQIALDSSSSLSLRGDTIAEAIYTNAQNADSTQTHNEAFLEMDCHADKSARNDGSNAPNATNARKSAKDSKRDYSASAESMDCHADKSARNDSSFGHCERSEAIHNSSPKQAKHSFCGKATSPVLRDDSGENISHLNPHFCELTAMYWAWKNVDSSYYGLFHYRRVLDLSQRALRASPNPVPIILKSTQYNESTLGLTKPRIQELLTHYDIILSQAYVDHRDNLDFSNMSVYDVYAKYHYASDLDAAIDIILERYPQMQAAIQSALFTKPSRWHIANMFIMRKELYFAYCEWIFDILFRLQDRLDISSYNPYQARIYGFIAERLFNVWLEYKRQSVAPRILEAPLILFTHKKPLIGWDINEKHKRFYLFGVRVYKKSVNPKS